MGVEEKWDRWDRGDLCVPAVPLVPVRLHSQPLRVRGQRRQNAWVQFQSFGQRPPLVFQTPLTRQPHRIHPRYRRRRPTCIRRPPV